MTTDFITVTPWTSGGRHRLYVSDRRRSLGFLDESTGTVVLTDARHRPVVERALRTAGYPHRTGGHHDETAEPAGGARYADAPPERGTSADAAAAGAVRHRPDRTVTGSTATGSTLAGNPEQVWADLAAGRAPRAASAVPHGRRDPAATLTALLRGEPPPSTRPREKVAATLDALVDADPLWQALEVDGSEIDHLLVGPGGVFTVSTKVYPGATVQVSCRSIVVDNTDYPWVHAGLHACRRTARALSQTCHQAVAVTTLLVVDAGRLTTTLPPPVGVVVLDHRHLCRWLHAQPETLTPGTVAMLADAAQQSTSWYRRRDDF